MAEPGLSPPFIACSACWDYGFTMRLLTVILLSLAVSVALAASPPARAESDQDRARAAVRAGQIQPLNAILNQIRGQVPGRVLGVNLYGGRRGQPWVYDIRMLTPRGDVVQLRVDARSANVISMRGQSGGDRKHRRRRRR